MSCGPTKSGGVRRARKRVRKVWSLRSQAMLNQAVIWCQIKEVNLALVAVKYQDLVQEWTKDRVPCVSAVLWDEEMAVKGEIE